MEALAQQQQQQLVASADVGLTAQDRPRKRHQVAKACQHCAVSHLSCSDHRPCARCVKKGLDCEERPRKKRNLGQGRTERRGDEEELDDYDLELEPMPKAPRARSRKPKRKADMNVDDEYVPEDELHHSHEHGHAHPHLTISPTSASPRTHNHSESSDEKDGSDLDTLIVAALAEEQQQQQQHPERKYDPAAMDPAVMMAQASMLSMMQHPMMPMMPGMMQMPQQPQQPQQQQQQQQAMAYGYQMPFMPGMMPMDQFGMMQFPMVPIQWRFHGQPMAPPLAVPVTANVRDLFGYAFNRLAMERQILSHERLTLSVVVNNQRYPLDDNAHAAMPLSAVGFADPTAVLEVLKFTPK